MEHDSDRGSLLDDMRHDSEEVSIALSIFFVPSTYLMNPCLPSSTNLMNPCETSPSRPKKEESCCLCRVWKKEKHIISWSLLQYDYREVLEGDELQSDNFWEQHHILLSRKADLLRNCLLWILIMQAAFPYLPEFTDQSKHRRNKDPENSIKSLKKGVFYHYIENELV